MSEWDMNGLFQDTERDWVSVPPQPPASLRRPEEPYLDFLRQAEAPPSPLRAAEPPASPEVVQCFRDQYDHQDTSELDEGECLLPAEEEQEEDRDSVAPGQPPASLSAMRPAARYGKVKKGEYQFIVRSFAPFDNFGGGYEGDERSFSTSLDVTSRITQTINITPGPKPAARANAWSDPSRGHGWFPRVMRLMGGKWPGGNLEATAEPHQQAKLKTVGTNHLVQAAYDGKMPLSNQRMTPAIDVSTTFVIAREGNVLHVFGSIRGDAFPNAEILARDSSGQVVFLHGFQTAWGKEGPLNLFGDVGTPMGSFQVDLTLDDDGNFAGARLGDKAAKRDVSVAQLSESNLKRAEGRK